MSPAGWGDRVGDDVDDILNSLSGDEDAGYPKGFAGLTPTTLTTLLTGDVTCPLSAYLKPNRLVLGAAACVDKSFVMDLKVGTISLNVGSQGVPAVAFARDAVGTTIDAAVWASPSVAPVVRIYNGTAGTIIYEGGIFGPVSRTQPKGA